ncbi:MAG: hypothetical protein N2109_02410 [Fimbriimonadales bacterium]|nr:hypothetical protein [Fimbriimonadales bacterium]
MTIHDRLPGWLWPLLTSEEWVRLRYLRLSIYACSRLVASGLDPGEGPKTVEDTLLGVARGDVPIPSSIASEEAIDLWLYEAVAQRLGIEERD